MNISSELFILSGNIESRVAYLDQKYRFRQYFDLEIYSYESGFNKPQKEFVEALLQKTDLNPEEMVCIDNEIDAAQSASSFGIKTILYRTGEIKKLKNDLIKFGVTI